MWTDFVDATFVINLPHRKDRWQLVNLLLRSHQIPFVTWNATYNNNGVAGLIKTMQYLFLHCMASKYNRVCVFEDDIKILNPQFNDIMDKCVGQLPADFDLFYMGGNVWKQPVRISDNLIQSAAVYSSHAIIYSKEAIKEIYHVLVEAKPYDVTLVNKIQKQNKCYVAYPLLVSQHTGYSDIEKKQINYDTFIEKRYSEKTKGL